MSLTKLMEISVGNLIDRRMQLFIYDMICLNEYTDEDIETIKSYEGPNEIEKHRVIDEMIKACKVFKTKHVLLKKELPPVDQLLINITRIQGQINPKVVLEIVDPKRSDDTADAAGMIQPTDVSDPIDWVHANPW